MERRGIRKYAWVTAATDQDSAIQAAILGRSLARVVTIADTILLLSGDLDHGLRLVLAEYFDAVIQVDEQKEGKTTNLSNMDILKMFALNMEMYAKIIVISHNTLVLQNCDELFQLEKMYYVTEFSINQSRTMSPVCVLKPNSVMYGRAKKLAFSQQCFCLSDVIVVSCDNSKVPVGKLSSVYNSNVTDFQINSNQHFETFKIIFYESPLNLALNGGINAHRRPNVKTIADFWTSCWEEIQKATSESNILDGSWEVKNRRPNPMIRSYYKDSIAIVGHSCRFPEANSSEEFWDLLIKGGDGIRSMPLDRVENLQLNEKQFNRMKGGFLKCPIDEFDSKFFGISPREAELIDPQQRLLLEVAWEALENAAINPHSLKGGNTGVFTGVWQADYERLVKENTSSKAFHNVVLGNSFSATSARISYILGLNGPNIATESGCSSSLVALHLACESLIRRETDLGMVMGANLVLSKDMANEEVTILAKDGHCKTFDEKADGFGRAEGIAAIILKRLPDAIKNGDRVMGIIRGTAMSNEGTSSSFGTPSKICQEIAVRDALFNSGVLPEEVDYVEAHGTGTPVGDPIEFAALTAGYAAKREKPLIIGSVKTNTGHCESAAGLAGIIKVLLSMKHEIIPPHKNFDTLNPNINLDALPAILPLEQLPWKRNESRTRIAGVSSFGISGTNVHAVLEEPPNETEYSPIIISPLESERTHHILTLSAKTENALNDLSNLFVKFLNNNTKVDIRDLTFTANNGRAHFKHRLNVIGKNSLELAKALENSNSFQPGLKNAPKIAFLFTGQGSQYFGMANALYQSNCVFKNSFDECTKIVNNKIGICLIQVLWGNNQESRLDQCVSSQLSIFSVEYALLNLLRDLGIKPDAVLGHSVGEYAAAVASKIINLEDALELLIARSQLISTLPSGGMMAITCSKEMGEQLISMCGKGNKNFVLDIAVINSPGEIVVAGKKEYLETFQQICVNNRVHCKTLAASHAFHSRDIDAILPPFSLIANKIKYNNPVYQYVSGTTGVLLDKTIDGLYWLQHARESVNFQKGIQTLAENGCNTFIEVGPRPILLALGMGTLSAAENNLWLPTLHANRDNWETLLESLGKLYTNGVDVNWSAIDTPEIRKKLELPTYPFQRQKYWINLPEVSESREIHPFLGKKVSLASVKEIVYSNHLSLENFPYLKDHQVANLVIMPGAGFLEMILAAGNDILVKSTRNALHVQDFSIEAPLEMEDGKLYEMQVVASPIRDQSLKICVHSMSMLNGYNNEKGWKIYATAVVSVVDNEDIQSKFPTKADFDTIKSRFADVNSSSSFYKRAYDAGINFGDTFRVWDNICTIEDQTLATSTLEAFPDNISEYFCHPIILDAMVQSVGLVPISKSDSNAYLPVRIDNCYTFGRSLSNNIFVHSNWNEKSGSGSAVLYNEDNDLVAIMTGVHLVRTTVSSFLVSINAQRNKLPDLFQDFWRPRLGPMQARVDFNEVPDFKTICTTLEKTIEGFWKPWSSPLTIRNEFIRLRLFDIFEEMGLSFEVGKQYNTRFVMQDNLVSLIHIQFFDRLIEMFVEDGFVLRSKDTWQLIKPFSTHFEQRKLELHSALLEYDPIAQDLLVKCLNNIKPVFQGNLAPVPALFDRTDMDITDVYTKTKESNLANAKIANFLNIALKNSKPDNKEAHTVRIVEIGGGSASTSIEILKLFQKSNISVQYCFTDISSQFFENAMKNLSSFEGVEYKVLDIEKDPSAQGFCPHYFDVAVASNVIHATSSLKKSIGNIRKLLVDRGLLILQEMLEPVRHIDITFGILDSYWKFNDFDLRTHTMASKQTWDLVFSDTGFSQSQRFSNENEYLSLLVAKACDSKISSVREEGRGTWLLFCDEGDVHKQVAKKLATLGENVVQLRHGHKEVDYRDQLTNYVDMLDESKVYQNLDKTIKSNTVRGVVYLTPLSCDEIVDDELYRKALIFCKYIAGKVTTNIKVLVATRGAVCPINQSKVIPSGAVMWGMFNGLMNEVTKATIRLVDLDPDVIDTGSDAAELCFELFNESENLVSYRNKKKMVARFVALKGQTPPLILPKGGYKLEIPKSKRIDDLCFQPFRNNGLDDLDVQIKVKAISLNFRDILVIMKPEGYHTSFDAVGSDFAGIVSAVGSGVKKFRVGDEVFGFGQGTAASHVFQKESGMIFLKPAHFNFCEASTIPSTFLTAYYCLVTVAGLNENDTVLIHVASGGVGLFAIQIAKHIGARIVVTAGSHRKRSYLKSLGLKYVFHSRDLTFGDDINRITNGQGVNVVLNSLTGPGFKETTLKNCAENARFVEIGKMNIWETEDVRKLRSDVDYTIVDLEKVSPDILADIMQTVYKKDVITPVAYSRFDVTNIRDALNYFMKAQHIGKIVVSMPELLNVGNQLITKEQLFNKNATYLITGGLRGIGLEVAKWMADSGAECLVLIGRSAPNTDAIQVLSKLRSKSCRILTFEVDVGNIKQCEYLFAQITNLQLPPLKGVILSAGVLSDATFANQSWEKYQVVFNAKIRGCLNLHNCTKDMNLEHFITFSSLAAKISLIGQSNHSAANCFMDAFVLYRHSIGLPAQTVNWGAWSQVGAAVNSVYGGTEDFGLLAFSPNQGIAALQYIMSRPNLVQVGVAEMNVKKFQQIALALRSYLKELDTDTENGFQSGSSSTVQSEKLWADIEPMTLESRIEYIKKHLVTIIRKTLKLPTDEQINEHQIFSEMGLDSLMSVELRNKLQSMFGDKMSLNVATLIDHPTICGLSEHLAESTYLGNMEIKTEISKFDKEKDIDLAKQDSVLPDDITTAGNLTYANNIENVFLTGVTGHMSGFLLKEILRNPQIKVFCLVRGSSQEHAQKRLVANLKKFDLLHSIDLNRVSVVVGDIAAAQFGIPDNEYQSLSENIDTVIHFAVNGSHVEKYQIDPLAKSDIRSVNVLGTINILRFAANVRTKRVYYSSSVSAVNKLDNEGFAYEEFPDDDNNGEQITIGYAMTKFVCEKLMKQAITRGIPCIVMRYPAIIGNSATGHFTVDSDFTMNLMLLTIKLGIIIDCEGGWSFLSADNAAELTAQIISNTGLPSGMYNLWQPTVLKMTELAEIVRDLGYPMTKLNEDVFFDSLRKNNDNSFIYFFKETYGPDSLSMLYNNNFVGKRLLNERKCICQISQKVKEAIPDLVNRMVDPYTLIKRCLTYAKSSGIFKEFNIIPSTQNTMQSTGGALAENLKAEPLAYFCNFDLESFKRS